MSSYYDPLFNPHQPTAVIYANTSLSPTQSAVMTQIKMNLAIQALSTSINRFPVGRSTNVNFLKQELKKTQKLYQKHPKRKDLELRVLELQKSIRELQAKAKGK